MAKADTDLRLSNAIEKAVQSTRKVVLNAVEGMDKLDTASSLFVGGGWMDLQKALDFQFVVIYDV